MTIVTLIFCMVVLFASGVNAAERLVGLVEIPVFHGGNYEEALKHPKGSVRIFEEPSGTASVVAVMNDFTQLEARHHDYEMLSAVFYELRHTSDSGAWFKVRYRLKDEYSFAWLKGADAGKIHTYFELAHSHPSYFTKSWDKRVFQLPNKSSTTTIYTNLGERQHVVVASASGSYMGRKNSHDLWFLIVIIKGDMMGDDDDMTIIGTGWVPAYAEDGSETVWFNAAGC